MRKYKTPFSSSRSRKTYVGWWYVRMIFVKTDLHLGVSWGVAWTVGSERETQPTLAIQLWDVEPTGPWNLFFFSECLYDGVFSSHSDVGTKDPVATGSWELELISPGCWDTELHQTITRCHCHRHGINNAVSTVVTRPLSFSLRFVLHSEYKLSSCMRWSERSY